MCLGGANFYRDCLRRFSMVVLITSSKSQVLMNVSLYSTLLLLVTKVRVKNVGVESTITECHILNP